MFKEEYSIETSYELNNKKVFLNLQCFEQQFY